MTHVVALVLIVVGAGYLLGLVLFWFNRPRGSASVPSPLASYLGNLPPETSPTAAIPLREADAATLDLSGRRW